MNRAKISRAGVVVVLFAMLLPVLIILLGFSIDYANVVRIRNEARAVSDLAAKAAADTLARTGGDVAQARLAAKAVASQNLIAGTLHQLQDDEIAFGRATLQGNGAWTYNHGMTPYNSVRVFARRNPLNVNGSVPQFFGMFYGHPTFEVQQQATASFRDVEICLVLDRSGSMKWKTVGETNTAEQTEVRCQNPNGSSRWRSLDRAIDDFLDELDATSVQERVALVTFASDGQVDCSGITSTASSLDQTLTYSTASIRTCMNNLNTSVWFGGTNITAGLNQARLHMEANAHPNRDRFIILFTDGSFNDGGSPFAEATACNASGITVHTITFSDDANTADMITTATDGGGEHYHADGTNELKTVFKRLAGSFAILTD